MAITICEACGKNHRPPKKTGEKKNADRYGWESCERTRKRIASGFPFPVQSLVKDTDPTVRIQLHKKYWSKKKGDYSPSTLPTTPAHTLTAAEYHAMCVDQSKRVMPKHECPGISNPFLAGARNKTASPDGPELFTRIFLDSDGAGEGWEPLLSLFRRLGLQSIFCPSASGKKNRWHVEILIKHIPGGELSSNGYKALYKHAAGVFSAYAGFKGVGKIDNNHCGFDLTIESRISLRWMGARPSTNHPEREVILVSGDNILDLRAFAEATGFVEADYVKTGKPYVERVTEFRDGAKIAFDGSGKQLTKDIKDRYTPDQFLASQGIHPVSGDSVGDAWYVCPLHEDTDPSFHIFPGEGGRRIWHCFSCSQQDDPGESHCSVIDLAMDLLGLPFLEARNLLAGNLGLDPASYATKGRWASDTKQHDTPLDLPPSSSSAFTASTLSVDTLKLSQAQDLSDMAPMPSMDVAFREPRLQRIVDWVDLHCRDCNGFKKQSRRDRFAVELVATCLRLGMSADDTAWVVMRSIKRYSDQAHALGLVAQTQAKTQAKIQSGKNPWPFWLSKNCGLKAAVDLATMIAEFLRIDPVPAVVSTVGYLNMNRRDPGRDWARTLMLGMPRPTALDPQKTLPDGTPNPYQPIDRLTSCGHWIGEAFAYGEVNRAFPMLCKYWYACQACCLTRIVAQYELASGTIRIEDATTEHTQVQREWIKDARQLAKKFSWEGEGPFWNVVVTFPSSYEKDLAAWITKHCSQDPKLKIRGMNYSQEKPSWMYISNQESGLTDLASMVRAFARMRGTGSIQVSKIKHTNDHKVAASWAFFQNFSAVTHFERLVYNREGVDVTSYFEKMKGKHASDPTKRGLAWATKEQLKQIHKGKKPDAGGKFDPEEETHWEIKHKETGIVVAKTKNRPTLDRALRASRNEFFEERLEVFDKDRAATLRARWEASKVPRAQ